MQECSELGWAKDSCLYKLELHIKPVPTHAIKCFQPLPCGSQYQEPRETRLAVQEYVAIRQALLAKSFPASAAAVANAAVKEDAGEGEEAAGNCDDHEQSAGECAPAG